MRNDLSLLVLGTTTFATEVADVACAAGYEVAGFVEALRPTRAAKEHAGRRVFGIDDIAALAESHLAVCGVRERRREVVEAVSACGLGFATVLHPTAFVLPTTTIGEGSLLGAGVAISGHTEIGRHVLIDRGGLVGHHTVVSDYVAVHAGANVAGSCAIGEEATIAMGAVVVDHVRIGARSVVAAGAVVVKDVPDGVAVAGVPARVVEGPTPAAG